DVREALIMREGEVGDRLRHWLRIKHFMVRVDRLSNDNVVHEVAKHVISDVVSDEQREPANAVLTKQIVRQSLLRSAFVIQHVTTTVNYGRLPQQLEKLDITLAQRITLRRFSGQFKHHLFTELRGVRCR